MYGDFFSERLTKLRQAKGVSARDMSLSIGQNENYINHIENRKMLPSMTVFFYICEYLKISPKDFFDNENSNPELVNKLVGTLQNLDETDIALLLRLAEKFAFKTQTRHKES